MISTVQEFYKARVGLFFVLIVVLFGFLSGVEHRAIALFFLGSNLGISSLFIVWLLYTFLCGQFILQLWKTPAYHFVYQTRLWSKAKQIKRFGWMAFGILQPLAYYGIFLFYIAFQENKWLGFWPVPLIFCALVLLILAITIWRIQNPVLYVAKDKSSLFKIPIIRPKSMIYWSLEYLIRQKSVTLLLSKFAVIIIFNAALSYYSIGEFDIRMPAWCLSLAYLLNLGLSYELYRWDTEIMIWARSLPIFLKTRYNRLLFSHVLLLLPETVLFFKSNELTFVEMASIYVLGWSLIMLFHTWFYYSKKSLEDSIQTVLFAFVALTFAILYKVSILLLAVVLFYASYRFFVLGYHKKASN